MEVARAIQEAVRKMGLEDLKEKQNETVTAFLRGSDVFLTVPTGYGKSIVFGVLPYAFDFMRGKHIKLILEFIHIIDLYNRHYW